MKIILTHILVIVLSVSVLGQSKTCARKTSALEKAYTTKSTKLLTRFLDNWHKATKRELKKTRTLDSTSNIIYSIHRELFDPFDYKKFGWDAWGDRTWFTGTKYIVIQDDIPFTTKCDMDTLNVDSDYTYTDTLFSFHPDIKFNDVKTLFMLEEYRCVAKQFIQANTFEKEMEYYEKKVFLDTLLATTMKRNWTAIYTQPRVIGIALCNYRLAVVDYEIASTGMRSWLKFENERWTIKDSIELRIGD
jgi:hypothetical protein